MPAPRLTVSTTVPTAASMVTLSLPEPVVIVAADAFAFSNVKAPVAAVPLIVEALAIVPPIVNAAEPVNVTVVAAVARPTNVFAAPDELIVTDSTALSTVRVPPVTFDTVKVFESVVPDTVDARKLNVPPDAVLARVMLVTPDPMFDTVIKAVEPVFETEVTPEAEIKSNVAAALVDAFTVSIAVMLGVTLEFIVILTVSVPAPPFNTSRA